eukprot:2910119-Lingulodinium_polyedra.AAC.1
MPECHAHSAFVESLVLYCLRVVVFPGVVCIPICHALGVQIFASGMLIVRGFGIRRPINWASA